MIEIENLCSFYKEKDQEIPVLKDISLTIEDDTFLALIGTNGSGKSTLARHLNGLLLPKSGRVLIDDLDTKDGDKLWPIRQRVGMVFQNPDNQLVASTVEEDIAFGPENLGLPSSEIRERVEKALCDVHMKKYRKHAPHQLSGGQKQKVAIAGALAMGSKYLVLDEPTAMLDPVSRKEVMQTLHELRREKRLTIILITHYMEEAALADRVVILEDGKIVLSDVPKAVFCQVELLKRLGLDVPPMTEMAHILRNAGLDIPADIFTVDEMVKYLCPYL